jgi:hypothetical protein
MVEIVWEPEALKVYNQLMDPKKGLALYQRQQLSARVDELKEWPPQRWFFLVNRLDGLITFQLETHQFVEVLGYYHKGVVKVVKVENKRKAGK